MSPDATLDGDQVTLVPVGPEHVAELRRIAATGPVRARWGEGDAACPQWPLEAESSVRFAVVAGGAVCGMIQYGEETDPEYRHAFIDIFLDPAVYGRGLCRDAVGTLARHLVRGLGHHRLVIDPAADNEAAIRCYTKVGFRPVGIMRNYERNVDGTGWHDGLLMDLLAEDLDQAR